MIAYLPEALEMIRQRKAAYQALPQIARDDLAKFCRADETCWDEDARHHARLEGRREVWLRVSQHLGLTVNDLAALYGAAKIPPPQGDDQ